jgi:hypothetical protein
MIPKSAQRFSEKIMLEQESLASYRITVFTAAAIFSAFGVT